jgi:hypothetical protein
VSFDRLGDFRKKEGRKGTGGLCLRLYESGSFVGGMMKEADVTEGLRKGAGTSLFVGAA